MTARTEYGARLADGVVYLHDFNAAFVTGFVADMNTVTPIHLVTREVDGDKHGRWVTTTREKEEL